ncbi:MAG: cytochrome b N-terminal domain-containing protein [Candidatus Poribacteria bacterium]|nr:cytochrome b N-terminal domain-containing protein [Candidatus Poribacteria bacterium]
MNERRNGLKEKITNSQIWRSMFRHGYEDTGRRYTLQILQNVWMHLHPPRLPRHALNFRFTWCMGGITFLMFLVTAVTGVLLMFYYRPTAEYAFHDVQYLEFDIPFGMLLRNMHRWSAHGMVIAVMLHMFRVFLTGSYKKPREFNWSVGVILLLVTFFLSFTGYLLPWDQLAFWAVTVGTNMARATPVLGHEGPFHPHDIVTQSNDVRFALLGGTIVGPSTLLRFYILHCVAVPLLASVLIALHFWRVRKDGGISGPL